MEYLPKDKIIKFNADTLETVRRKYGLDNLDQLETAIDLLEDWVRKQSHFDMKTFDRSFLERTIIQAKGSIEKAKFRLDKYCSYKSLLPLYFGDFHPRDEFRNLDGNSYVAFLPKLTKDNERVVILKFVDGNFDFNTSTLLIVRRFILMAEYVKGHDYADAFILIVDDSELDIAQAMPKINPIHMKNGINVILEGFGARCKAVHIVSPSKVIELVIKLIKQIVSEKINKRIHTHRNIENLKELVPKEILPIDYGGLEKPFKNICEDWLDELCKEANREYVRKMLGAGTDESLRQTDNGYNGHGISGTFKNLIID